MATKADRYEGIDGLKAYAIIGIALMHVLANGEYGIGGFVFERLNTIIHKPRFPFMMVMVLACAVGYYQKLLTEDQRRGFLQETVHQNLAVLCDIALCVRLCDFKQKESLFEVFANLTLCQGLLPNAEY